MAKKKQTPTDITADIQGSMIYEKNDRSYKPPKSKKKLVLGIVIGLLVLLVGVPWLVIAIIGNSGKPYLNDAVPKHTYEELLKETVATEKSTELLALKNPEITDAAAVQALLDFLKTEEALGSYSLSVKNDAKPYQITLTFTGTHDVTSDVTDDWTKTMITYSTALLALIDNISQVNWSFPSGNSTSGAYFTRADAEQLLNLGVPAKQFASSAQSIQLLLNQLNIELY